MRRDSNDEQWQEVKKSVFARDTCCRLIKVLTAVEFLVLQKNAGYLLNRFDPAHVLGVGPYPSLIYDPDNIVKLNRYSHECLDTMKCPIDGNPITKEAKRLWWERIIGTEMYESLLNKLKEKEDGRAEGSSCKD